MTSMYLYVCVCVHHVSNVWFFQDAGCSWPYSLSNLSTAFQCSLLTLSFISMAVAHVAYTEAALHLILAFVFREGIFNKYAFWHCAMTYFVTFVSINKW